MSSDATYRNLWLGFGGLSGILVLSLLLIAFRLDTINEQAQHNSDALLRDDTARALGADVAAYADAVREYSANHDGSSRATAQARGREISSGVETYRRLMETPDQESYLQSFSEGWQELQGQGDAVLFDEESLPSQQRLRLVRQLETRLEHLVWNQMQPESSVAFAQVRGSALSQFRELFRIVLAMLGFVVVLALMTSVIVGRSILRKERELTRGRAAQAHLAALVQSSDDAIVSKSLEGVIETWNDGAARLFGYTADEAIGRPVTMLIPPERMSEEEEILCRIRSGQRIDTFDSIRIRKDGSRIPVSLTISPIKDSSGRVTGASKIARDISERERHERALIEADRRRTEFLAVLAHELRNPLAPIATGLEVLGHTADPAKRSEIRAVMKRQADQLVSLVDDLMDVSRITQGKMEVRKQRVSLAEVVQTAVETARPAIERARHALTVDGPPEPMELDADPVRLAQAISNLLHNAAKFTPEGGSIALTASEVDGEAEIRVKDNGVGISQELQDRIFDMFTQGGHPLEKSQPGLGIGLTLVRSLVQMHGGSISVESSVGEGAEFRVRLPLATEPEEKKPRAPAMIEGSRRILVVDDNEAAAEMLSLLLTMSGHDVRTVHSGIEALDIFGSFQPELVLLDLGMPGMDGYATAERLRSTAGQSVMLVALTGWGQDEDRRRSREAGFDVHLVKPLRLEDLQELLKKLPDHSARTV